MNSDVIFTLTCIVLAVNLDAVSACAGIGSILTIRRLKGPSKFFTDWC